MGKNTPITPNALVAAWQGYADSIKQTTPSVSTLIQSISPTLSNNTEIRIVTKSAVQQEQIQGLRQALLDHLKRELQNTNITLQIDIDTEQNSSTNHLYTKEDLLKDMISRKPALGQLMARLNLQIE